MTFLPKVRALRREKVNRISFASEHDIKNIMQFIDKYWKKGHILGINEDFFQYEHNIDGEVTYVISKDEENHINAILGYIPYGKEYRDVMTVMWKANRTGNPGLGIKLLQYLIENDSIRIVASPGINKSTIGIYRYMGYTVGVMTHWYRLNKHKDIFKIANIFDKEIPYAESCDQINLIELKEYSVFEDKFDFHKYENSNPKPRKERSYIERRYFKHPIYCYNVYGVEGVSGKMDTVFVFRIQECNGVRALRLIDCIGVLNNITRITMAIDELMVQYDTEYIDCYETGLKDEMFLCSGWKKVIESGNIIPNYFSPYMQENIDINFFSTDPDVVLFKGDGDQDRPN